MAMLDLYCERVGPGLLGEPWNGVSNLAFLASAAWLAVRLGPRADLGVRLLIGLIAAIGLGSTLFHSLATGGALLADVLPILLFQLTFLALVLRRQLGLGVAPTAGLVGLFLLACLGARVFPVVLNGSLSYLPGLAVLSLLGWQEWRSGRRPLRLLPAAALFSLSLVCRSVDQWACSVLPHGTHAFWHLLNALVLTLTVLAVPSRRQSGAVPGRP